MSLLFPKLNEQQTLENVSEFFKYDLDRLLIMSGCGLTDLTSPQLSAAPGSSNFGNANEIKMVNGISAEAMVKAVSDTIQHCSYNSEIILIELFVRKKSWQQVKTMVYSETHKFSYLRHKAMLEFADGFNRYQIENHCQPRINLLSYLK